jgi:hypothetical protein
LVSDDRLIGMFRIVHLSSLPNQRPMDVFSFTYAPPPPKPKTPPLPPPPPPTAGTDLAVKNLERFVQRIDKNVDWQLMVSPTLSTLISTVISTN